MIDRINCKGCLVGTTFELETDDGIVTIKCAKCGEELDSKYVKEEMLYFSKREGYRTAYNEVENFVTEKQENDMVKY